MDLGIPPAEWDDLPLANRGGSDVPPAPMAEHDGTNETDSITNTVLLIPRPGPQLQQLQLQQQHDGPDRDNTPHDANSAAYSVGDSVCYALPPNAIIQQHKPQQGGQQSSMVSPRATVETTSCFVAPPIPLEAAKPSRYVATIAIAAEGTAVVASRAAEAALIGGQGRPAKQPSSRCRAFSAGYCSTTLVNKQYCKHGFHDAAGAEKERRAWLAAIELAPSVDWGNGGGLFRGAGAAVGVPTFLLVTDIPTKQGLTEFLCIAMETSSGRQLGRYHRYILASRPDASEGGDSTGGGGSDKNNLGNKKTTAQIGGVNGSINSHTTAVPFTTVLDELKQWMASLGLNPGVKNEKGLCEDGNFRWVVCGESGLRQIPNHLAHTYNVQLPDHLRSWTDAARVCALLADRVLTGATPDKIKKTTGSRRGRGGGGGKAGSGGHNGNTVGCGNRHVLHAGGEKVEAIVSSVPGAAVGEGDGNGSGGQQRRRQRQKWKRSRPVSTVAGDSSDGVPILQPPNTKRRRQPKKHCLPRSGLAGMFKFFEAPVDVLGCPQRGMEAAVAIAQCTACLLRRGASLPITSRVTPVWGPGGEYQGSIYDELAVADFDSNMTLPRVSPASSRGTDRAPTTTPPSEEMGPSTTSKVHGAFDSVLSVQETKANERRPRERNRKRASRSNARQSPARDQRVRSAGDGSTRGVGSRGELDGGSAGPGGYRDGESDGASSIHDGGWRYDRDSEREPRERRKRHLGTGGAGERAEDSPRAAGDRALAGSRSGGGGESYRDDSSRNGFFPMPKVDSSISDRRRVSEAAPPRESRERKGRNTNHPGRMEYRCGGAPESAGGRDGDRNREWERNRGWGGHSGARAEGGGALDVGRDIGMPHWRQGMPENRGRGGPFGASSEARGALDGGHGIGMPQWCQSMPDNRDWRGHSGVRAEGGGALQGGHDVGIPQWRHGIPKNRDWGGPFGAWAEGGGMESGHPTGMPQWHRSMPERGGAPGGGHGIGMLHWRQSMPVKALAEDYLDYFVRDRERHYYKSAGILPYRYDPGTGEVSVLLGSEMRKNQLVLSCLGGKREDLDAGPEHTAWREFWEESGKVLGEYDRTTFLAACVEGSARALWIQSAKMLVFACELNSPGFVDLPRWYAAGAGAGVDKGDTSMLALHWVSAADLTRACHERHGKVVVWGLPPPPPPPQQPHGSGRTEVAGGAPLHWHQDRHGNHIDGRGRGGGGGGSGGSAPLSLPLSLPLQLPLPPSSAPPTGGLPQPAAPTVVGPYPLLKTLISDRAFRVFFEHLAAAGTGRHAVSPVL